MIRWEAVTVTYPNTEMPALRDVTLHIPEGELAVVVGHTGVGKTTLLRTVNGLVPHFSGGRLAGRVLVAGRDTRTHPPRELADVIGMVGQNPAAGFVTDTVEDELAYGMESLGLAPDVMRRRVEESVDLLGLAALRDRPLHTLSAGQQQRVAIGSVLTTHPRVLVLDEPTSALDPGAAEDVLAALHRLVHDLGLTVVLAEHRLERVVQFADRMVIVERDGSVSSGAIAETVALAPVQPPIVELGLLLNWQPPPVSIRDARRLAAPIRDRLASVVLDEPRSAIQPPCIQVLDVSVNRGPVTAVRNVNLSVAPGEIVALMGRNGAGKTTLLRTLVGLHEVRHGRIEVSGKDPRQLAAKELATAVGFVPADPADLLWSETVADECRAADHDAGTAAGATYQLLTDLCGPVVGSTHPRDLSEGQRLGLGLAIVLVSSPRTLLLDEPTRGLDYTSKRQLIEALRIRASNGTAVMLATHDVELVAEVATRVVVMADGEVVTDGPLRSVVVSSPQFAPQVSKILAPYPFLTVSEVSDALAAVS